MDSPLPRAPDELRAQSFQLVSSGPCSTISSMFGGHMGNPNPLKQAYRCYTCGEPRPPYQFYCERHLEDGEKTDKPLLIDRLMRKILGRT